MNNGIKLVVTHSSFAEAKAREEFSSLLLTGWDDVRNGQGIDITPVCKSPEENEEVHLFFAYGDSGIDVKSAEMAAAAAMATLSLYVMQSNQKVGSDVVHPAYGFAVERDVPIPFDESTSPPTKPNRKRIAARSSS